jgi:putative Holliday junction resolvase
MKRIMALDVGDVRIGVALSDPLGMIASPFEVIDRKKIKALDRIAEIVKQKNVGVIVSGMPYSLDGSLKVQAEKVKAFLEKLEEKIEGIEIKTMDERYTTTQADKTLNEMTNKDAREKRKVVDKVAATIILQNYLEMMRNKQQTAE